MTDDELRARIVAAALTGSALPLKDLRARKEQMTQGVSNPAVAAQVEQLMRSEASALAEAAVTIADAVIEALARRKKPPPG